METFSTETVQWHYSFTFWFCLQGWIFYHWIANLFWLETIWPKITLEVFTNGRNHCFCIWRNMFHTQFGNDEKSWDCLFLWKEIYPWFLIFKLKAFTAGVDVSPDIRYLDITCLLWIYLFWWNEKLPRNCCLENIKKAASSFWRNGQIFSAAQIYVSLFETLVFQLFS